MDEKQTHNPVAAYYNADPQREWTRFDRHPFEFPVTLHFLTQYLQPNSQVLDVGAGPGRYAIELAKAGHSVALVDISQKLLDVAMVKAQAAAVPMQGFHLGSATDLSQFADASQDVVLCMGPLYHLATNSERDTALRECLRVLRPGGLLYVAFISVLGRIFDMVRNYPEQLVTELDRVSALVNSSGAAVTNEQRFTQAYFVQPEEVAPLMSGYPLQQLELLGVEGLTSQSEDKVTSIDAKVTQAWIELAVRCAATPAALHGSDHLLYIGRKR